MGRSSNLSKKALLPLNLKGNFSFYLAFFFLLTKDEHFRGKFVGWEVQLCLTWSLSSKNIKFSPLSASFTGAKHGAIFLWGQDSGVWGRKIMSFRPAWATQQVQTISGYNSKTIIKATLKDYYQSNKMKKKKKPSPVTCPLIILCTTKNQKEKQKQPMS